MKKFYFLLIAIAITTLAWSQTTTWTNGNNNMRWDQGGNWTNGVPADGYIVIINNGTSPIITNVAAGGSITLNGLRIEGNSTVTLTNTSDNRTLTIDNGSGANDFNVEAGSSLTLANGGSTEGVSISLRNNRDVVASIAGTLIVANGRSYNSSNTNRQTTVTGIIDNRGTVTGTNSRLLFSANSKYIHAQNGGSIPVATWSIASDCNIEGYSNSTTAPGNLDQSFGNFTWNSQNQTGDISLAAELATIIGDFTVVNTGSGSIRLKNSGGQASTTTVSGNYNQTGGNLFIVGTSGTHTLSLMGNFNMSGGTLQRGGTSTSNVVFDRNGLQTFTKTGGTITGAVNFRIDNNSIVDFGTSVLDGTAATFTLDGQGKIITANASGLSSSGSIGSIQVGGNRTFNNGADYEFQGASTGNFSTGAGSQVRDLIINNTTGEVVAARDFAITRALTLSSGYLTTSIANTVTVGTGGSSTTANGAFVNGALAKDVTNTSTAKFDFHVGTVAAGLRTIAATRVPTGGASGTTTFTAQFFGSNPQTAYPGATLASGIQAISACGYWTLNRGTAGGNTKYNAAVTLSWNATGNCNVNINQTSTLKVLRHNGGTPGTWTDAGYASSTPSSVTSNTVSAFSPFTIGTTSAAANPLPVVFANVKAYEKNSGVQVEWSNMTEKDVAGYTIERSANGKDFASIGEQLPTSNQDDRANYTAFDASPLSGVNYYRIKAVETTGKTVYSKVLSVSLGSAAGKGLNVYPNPVSGNQVTVSLSNVKKGQYNLRVVNTAGQDVHKQVISNHSSTMTQTIDLPATVKPGVYNLVITGTDYRQSKQFIVQ